MATRMNASAAAVEYSSKRAEGNQLQLLVRDFKASISLYRRAALLESGRESEERQKGERREVR